METWKNLKKWSREEQIKCSIKILKELGMDSEQIQKELKLSKEERLNFKELLI